MKRCVMLQFLKPAILHNIKFGEQDHVVWGKISIMLDKEFGILTR